MALAATEPLAEGAGLTEKQREGLTVGPNVSLPAASPSASQERQRVKRGKIKDRLADMIEEAIDARIEEITHYCEKHGVSYRVDVRIDNALY